MTTTATSRVARRRSARRPSSAVARPGFAWAVPATLFFVLFAVVPLILVAVLSFATWDGLGSPQFAGLDNWRELIHDHTMIQSLWLSVMITVLGVVVQTPLSILLGVWAAGRQRNRAIAGRDE